MAALDPGSPGMVIDFCGVDLSFGTGDTGPSCAGAMPCWKDPITPPGVDNLVECLSSLILAVVPPDPFSADQEGLSQAEGP